MDGRGSGRGDRGGHSKSFSKGGRGGGRGNHRGKKKDMGRNAWSKTKGDKRKQNDDSQAAKRQKLENGDGAAALPVYATQFSQEDLAAEERRPKKKVAVLIGYSGTGYKGMQLAPDQKTIEGDLFKAFVAAGAISKANADDPKKSSFVRCARTDKGVHAAGNVISLKLIVEDEDVVKRINEHLNPQIRVWGYERTNNSFSAYQLVDSRIYEYLIPSYSFLPPHPRSYLGRKCLEWAEKKGELEAWQQRQKEVEGYWEKIDSEMIEPILANYDADIREVLEKALWLKSEEGIIEDPDEAEAGRIASKTKSELDQQQTEQKASQDAGIEDNDSLTPEERSARRLRAQTINEAVKRLRQAYNTAKRRYRIPIERLNRVRETLECYTGTRNYHNYTVQKSFRDASANRVIKSFVVSDNSPILIDETEWLSLKVHGQSFMMHQIRKMVGMAALIVRCGASPSLIRESYGPSNISIPKAPSLGLLLERPIFESYNRRATKEMGKTAIDFDKYKTEMDEFKQREIYDKIYRDEEKDNFFSNFFNHIDSYPAETFLFVTSGGIEATLSSENDNNTKNEAKSKEGGTTDNGIQGAGDGIGGESGARKTIDLDDEADSDIDDIKDDAGHEG